MYVRLAILNLDKVAYISVLQDLAYICCRGNKTLSQSYKKQLFGAFLYFRFVLFPKNLVVFNELCVVRIVVGILLFV